MQPYERTAEAYDLIQASRSRAAYDEHAAHVVRLIRDRNPSAHSLLDVACGTGMHLVEFARGFDVAGVDLTPAMLDRARPRLPGVDLRIGDMRDFDFGHTFDAVTCLFSSVGAMLTLDDLRGAIANMARHLNTGGILVIEPWIHPEWWRVPHLIAEAANAPGISVARVSTNGQRGHISTFDLHWTIATADGIEQFVEPHELGLYTIDEYRDAFIAAGLTVEHDPVGLIGRGLFIGVR
jgi:SAM-dependent methyltransferase